MWFKGVRPRLDAQEGHANAWESLENVDMLGIQVKDLGSEGLTSKLSSGSSWGRGGRNKLESKILTQRLGNRGGGTQRLGAARWHSDVWAC